MDSAVLLDEFAAWSRAAGHSSRTIDDRSRTIRQITAELGDLRSVAAQALTGWLGRDGLKPWTRATYRNTVRAFFTFMAEYGHRTDNPAARLRRPRVPASLPNPVTDAELAFLLACSPEPWRTIILLGAYAGLRVSEIAGLDRVDITEETILIRRGKGGTPALVPTHPRIWAHVKDRPSGPVVRTPRGQTLTGQSMTCRAREYFDSVGLPDVHLHMLRHWFGSSVQRRQGDIRVTQELMRHASIASTVIYTQVTTAAKVSAIMALDAA